MKWKLNENFLSDLTFTQDLSSSLLILEIFHGAKSLYLSPYNKNDVCINGNYLFLL